MLSRILFSIALVALLATDADAKEMKIGIIDMQKALNESKEGKVVLEKMKEKLMKEQDILAKKKDELKKMEDELQSQGFMMDEAKRNKKDQTLRKLSREFERYREDKQTEFMAEQRDATERIYKEILKTLNKYAAEKNFTLILEKGQQAPGVPGSLIYHDNSLDITNEIITLYNSKN
ncbi:MAG: OmpH family outer membrane protein [Nitrospinota bacterium]|nr:OmpH family outer membrane protein [Nitrospinota bacterium]